MQTDEDRRPVAAAAGGPSGADTRWHVDCAFVLAAIAGLLIARIPVIPVRFFDADELEHSHAAWSVFRGLLPYRDFFEHHTPWYYFALSPFFHWFAVDQSFENARRFLAFARGLSLVLTALSVVLVFLIGRLGANRRVGLLAGLFLVAQPVLIQKTLEIRPDVPALPFFLGGLWFLLRGLRSQEDPAARTNRSLGWFLGGGLCLGAAIMCTQKMLFVLPGAFTGLGLWALVGGRRTLLPRLLAVLTVLVGIAAPAAITWIAFAVQGGGDQFIYDNFIINAQWRQRSSSRHLLVTLETSWPMLVLCVVGASVAMYRFHRAEQRRYEDVLLLCTLGGLIAGIPVVPAAYKQYYLMPLPIACLFAAKGLVFLVALAQERVRTRLLVAATVLLLVWPAVELKRTFARRDERQMGRIRYVFEHTAPADSVLDGWLGTQLFRPHPLYYFFMHGELRAMLSEKDKDAYLGALESGRVRPALITLDDELLALGPRFVTFVRQNYVSDDGLFYRPARARTDSRP
jgi:dolichyl-phosphate-mannose-protein mannosyltransferase